MKHTIRVKVNDQLVLDAGSWEEKQSQEGEYQRLVSPPAHPMFQQVIEYLEALHLDESCVCRDYKEEALATTAVCLRWGTYFAVRADRSKRLLWKVPKGASKVSGGEMARINIEASAALAKWIEIKRNAPQLYAHLVASARTLPFPVMNITRSYSFNDFYIQFMTLADPKVRQQLEEIAAPESLTCIKAEVQQNATRVLSNAIINACWRNGPVEDIHAGLAVGQPLGMCRLTKREESLLLRSVATRLIGGLDAVEAMNNEKGGPTWAEQVLPYNMAHVALVTPSGWSIMADSCEFILADQEPEP